MEGDLRFSLLSIFRSDYTFPINYRVESVPSLEYTEVHQEIQYTLERWTSSKSTT